MLHPLTKRVDNIIHFKNNFFRNFKSLKRVLKIRLITIFKSIKTNIFSNILMHLSCNI